MGCREYMEHAVFGRNGVQAQGSCWDMWTAVPFHTLDQQCVKVCIRSSTCTNTGRQRHLDPAIIEPHMGPLMNANLCCLQTGKEILCECRQLLKIFRPTRVSKNYITCLNAWQRQMVGNVFSWKIKPFIYSYKQARYYWIMSAEKNILLFLATNQITVSVAKKKRQKNSG